MFVRHVKSPMTLIVVLLAASVSTNGCRKAVIEEEQNTLPDQPVPVKAVEARLTTLHPAANLVGTLVVIPERSTVISPQIGGWVQKVSVVEGARVGQGDELVVLDPRLAEVDVTKAEAALAEKQATLARLKRGYLPQEVEMARQAVRKCDEEADAIGREVAALEPLWKSKEVADLQYQKVESARRAAVAAQAEAQAHLDLLLAGTPQEEIDEAEARIGIAAAELASARLNLKLCRITSPISGTVTQVDGRPGAFIERSVPLLNIDDLSKLFLQVRVPGIYLAAIEPGAPVEVSLAAYPKRIIAGRVARISSSADSATGDVNAFVEVANEDGILRPGLACRAKLGLPEMPNVLAIPTAAVADKDGTAVVTVADAGKARTAEITVGAQCGDQVEVTAGLEAGQWVITEGGYDLPDDCPVKIVADASHPVSAPETP